MLHVCACDDIEAEYLDMNRTHHRGWQDEPKEKVIADAESADGRYSV